MMPADFVRVGVALTVARGESRRRDEYEILRLDSAYGYPLNPPKFYVRYIGYREQTPAGEVVWVGLALGGPGWHPQPLLDFEPEHFGSIKFFDGQPGQ